MYLEELRSHVDKIYFGIMGRWFMDKVLSKGFNERKIWKREIDFYMG